MPTSTTEPKLEDRLLTLDGAARVFHFATGETFRRFADRIGIPLVRFNRKVVLVRKEDLERAIAEHLEPLALPAPGSSTRRGARGSVNT